MAAKTVGLRVLSYNFETIKGKVYIAGVTSKEDQLKKLINSIKTIKGVKEIKNYVILKTGNWLDETAKIITSEYVYMEVRHLLICI